MANYVLAAVQYRKPQLKGQLKGPWQLVALWNKLEEPVRATPLNPEQLWPVQVCCGNGSARV